LKDARKSTELFETLSRIGYLYYQKGFFFIKVKSISTIEKFLFIKGYYEKAISEYEEALDKRETVKNDLDTANIHRFIGEALCKLGHDYKRAKHEFDIYHAITVKIKDLVEIQRSYITLGNYYMASIDDTVKGSRYYSNHC
jgi:hypothetical protein